jgi:hypothetical protein
MTLLDPRISSFGSYTNTQWETCEATGEQCMFTLLMIYLASHTELSLQACLTGVIVTIPLRSSRSANMGVSPPSTLK